MANNTGPHVGHLRDNSGNMLAEQTLTSTADGFPYIRFAEPVPIRAGSTYTVSYYTPPATTPPASSTSTTPSPTRGRCARPSARTSPRVYRYGEGGGLPTQTWHGSNYGVEPVFTTN